MLRNFFNKIDTKVWLSLVLFICAGLYWRIFYGFFQQDEWLSFAYRFLALSEGLWGVIKDSFSPSVGHFQPLNSLLLNVFFSFFKLNYLPYAILSLVFHLINVVLIYHLASIFFKDKRSGIVVSLIFGVSASTYQATSWVLADLGVHGATVLSLLSLIFLLKFFDSKSEKHFNFSLISLGLSLLFKEISIGLFILIPIWIYFFGSLKNKKRYFSKIFALLAVYVALRVSMVFVPASYLRDVLSVKNQNPRTLIYNLATLPLKGLSQTIIPANVLTSISYSIADRLPESVTGIKDTPSYDVFVQKTILEAGSLLSALLIFGILILIIFKDKNSSISRSIVFGFLIIIINSPIFALAPEKFGTISVVDSRNLYLLSVGAGFVIWSLIVKLSLGKSAIRAVLLFSLLAFNGYILDKQLSEIVERGIIRRNILTTIFQGYPSLPAKVIFYTESDTALYGLAAEERVLPFQSGFGQTLLVWYFPTQNLAKGFFEDRFLWEITDEGYQEIDNKGFGYFRNFDKLVQTIQENNIRSDSIISYRFDSLSKTVTDNSEEVRGRVVSYLSKESKVNRSRWELTPTYRQDLIHFAIDGNRRTFWDSKTAYYLSQKLVVDLGEIKRISLVELDSYNNKDQNLVGYEVSLSSDAKSWKRVFYSKVHPPDERGFNRLYFMPQNARFVRIEQSGTHKFASWVINELNIYESSE